MISVAACHDQALVNKEVEISSQIRTVRHVADFPYSLADFRKSAAEICLNKSALHLKAAAARFRFGIKARRQIQSDGIAIRFIFCVKRIIARRHRKWRAVVRRAV